MFMLRRLCVILACTAACLTAQEVPASTIPQLTKDGDALYLKGDYEGARLAFTSAWELAQQTPRDNPVRYDILKRLTSVRAAAGEFADADNWLQLAIHWRENTLGQKDPKIADDLLILVGLCRGMKDLDRALVVLRRVQGLHAELYTFDSAAVADDLSRMGSVYAEQKKIDDAINSVDAALEIRTKLGGPRNPRRRHGRPSLRRGRPASSEAPSRPYRPAISMPSFLSSSE
jgi:tetratricopeptide (TPR) repeat protein